MRLIDADALADALFDKRKNYPQWVADTICGMPTIDVDVLLKGQEGIIPYIDIDEAKCPICKVKLTRQELIGDDVLFEDFYDYCPHCGKPILWEGR